MISDSSEIKKVAIYTRVSTDEQAERGFSLDAQLDKLRSHCKNKEWDISAEYVDDGYTGRNIRRPNYTKMLEQMNKWEAILVLKMDRIHRNSKNFMNMMDLLRKNNKEFISFSENLDTSTAMGRFVMDIIQRIAQLESEQIGERVAIAMVQKAKNGSTFMGHRVPFGYSWNAKKEIFIPKPEELEIVKKAFDLYNSGMSFRSIGKELGISNTSIRYYLNNIFYAGYERYCHYFRKINNGIEPTISTKIWNTTQVEMRSRCRSHNYDPILIPDNRPERFSLDKVKRNYIPVINRAKHNYVF